ncbi:MAG: ammonium transporter [Chloroflexota bacterium]|nr:MAG: ammonium transporter [Chloroflexota bacterium]
MNRRSRLLRRLIAMALGTLILAVFGTTFTYAQDEVAEAPAAVEAAADEATDLAAGLEALQVSIDSTFVFVASMFVFFMQAGFAFLEAGMIRQTGVVNSMMENFMDAAIGGIAFFATGFALALGTDDGSGLFGTTGFFLSGAMEYVDGAPVYGTGISVFMLFFFQYAFAATAGTIATGAMAERTNFITKIIYSFIVAGFTYPIVIHWIWGGGWLAQQGFLDFAGSAAVHLSGGMVALMGAILLGPRTGRVWGKPPRPHNLAYATLGTMILWLGWYGFNPGSALSMSENGLVGLVAVNTTLGAVAGAFVAMMFAYFRSGKWDLAASLNGSLAGLVAITAGCAFVEPWAAFVIGGIAGVLVLLSADLFERLRIDDPAGAFAVHGTCGIFGALAIGIFGQPELGANGLLLGGGIAQLAIQFTGVIAVMLWMGATSAVIFAVCKALGILRIPEKASTVGIDVYEHGATVWPDILPVPGEGALSVSTSAAGD